MVPLVKMSSDTLVKKVSKFAKSGRSVNMLKYAISYVCINATYYNKNYSLAYRVYQEFTFEAIIAVAFGCCVDIQGGEREADQLTNAARAFFQATVDGSLQSADFLIIILCMSSCIIISVLLFIHIL